MRVAALYDIHGNLPALEAVFEEVYTSAVDLIVVGGDAVLGPMPRETLEYLLAAQIPVQFIQGNCEREMLTQLAGGDPTSVPPAFRQIMQWVGDQLSAEQQQLIASWPVAVQLEIPGLGDVMFVSRDAAQRHRDVHASYARRAPARRHSAASTWPS